MFCTGHYETRAHNPKMAGVAWLKSPACYALQRRHGGSWRKEQLDDEAGAGAAAQHTRSFPDSQDVPKRPSPDKSQLFTGAPSHSFAVEAHSAL